MTHNPDTPHQASAPDAARRADAYLDTAQKMTKAKGVKYLATVANDDPEAFVEILGRLLAEDAQNG